MKILLSLFFLICLSSCGNNSFKSYYLAPIKDINNQMVMLLNTDIKVITDNPNVVDKAQEIITTYHRYLDPSHNYQDINNLKTLNDNYNNTIDSSAILNDALKTSFEYSTISKGYFNPSIGSLSSLYKDYYDGLTHLDPNQEKINEALNCEIKYQDLNTYIAINNTNITFNKLNTCHQEVIIDLGGFSKGYILNKVKEAIKDESYLISTSSSIIAHHKDNKDYDITITYLNEPILTIKKDNFALSSSSDEQRYYFNEDNRRNHILNPYTGTNTNDYKSITLIADQNAGLLDALSTAFYNMPLEDIKNIINKLKDELIIDYIILDKDNNLHITSNLKPHISAINKSYNLIEE